jgi:hypothetical protein
MPYLNASNRGKVDAPTGCAAMNRALAACGALVLLCACGPSTRDVALAKTARYRHDSKLALFEIVRATVEKKHQIVQSDEMALTINTRGRWYTPEGLASQWQPSDMQAAQRPAFHQPAGFDGGRQMLPDKSLHIALTIKLMPEGRNWIIYVSPTIKRFHEGMPNLEKVDPTAADVPTWATGKVDKLSYDIHRALRKYQVHDIDNSTPPPAEPDPDPAEPHPVDLPAIDAEGS